MTFDSSQLKERDYQNNQHAMEAMTIPKSILERIKQNEIIARKFHEIEISILSILNFQDFIEKLLSEIGSKFLVPYTWLSIIEESHITKYLHNIQNSKLLKTSTAFISKKQFSEITRNHLKPILSNNNLKRFDALIPEAATYDIGSIAIAPITMDGTIVGSINQADKSITRFEPEIDTSLLEQLAI